MKAVAILDLRGNNAWNYDWCLVCNTYICSKSTEHIAYFDECGDMVLFDGSEEEAREYYTRYCINNNLILVSYDFLEKLDEKVLEKENENYEK
jgi:hypothetical protein